MKEFFWDIYNMGLREKAVACSIGITSMYAENGVFGKLYEEMSSRFLLGSGCLHLLDIPWNCPVYLCYFEALYVCRISHQLKSGHSV